VRLYLAQYHLRTRPDIKPITEYCVVPHVQLQAEADESSEPAELLPGLRRSPV
jgi:hypothetical protein